MTTAIADLMGQMQRTHEVSGIVVSPDRYEVMMGTIRHLIKQENTGPFPVSPFVGFSITTSRAVSDDTVLLLDNQGRLIDIKRVAWPTEPYQGAAG